jgi:hypothetical protein
MTITPIRSSLLHEYAAVPAGFALRGMPENPPIEKALIMSFHRQ